MASLSPSPPPGAHADWTVPQDWRSYSAAEHTLWDRLYARQAAMLPGRASEAFLHGLETLQLSKSGIPDLDELSERLYKLTRWRVVTVPGLVPDDVFFRHLANRTFVAGRFIRPAHQIDYLEEPDIFHDVFGHVPLLSNPIFANYMQAYGQGGLRALSLNALHRLARLYWYTVEFGLIKEAGGLRIYGAGIVSSYGESRFALEDASPNRIGFNLDRVMRTRYRIDDYQQSYFVIDSFDALHRETMETDFAPLYRTIAPDLEPDAILESDIVLQRGTQAYARGRRQ